MMVTRDHILQAFPPAQPWRDPLPGVPPEILGIERDFRGKSWPEITTQLCNLHHDAYNFLDPKPLAFFLPAFLQAAVTDPKGAAAEFLVYFACSKRSLNRVLALLNEVQRGVLFGVVGGLLTNDDGYFSSCERKEFSTRLRELSGG